MKINVRKLREKLGLTQKRFAKLVGVHVITVSHWENEVQKPLPRYIHKMVKIKQRLAEAL